MKENDLTKFFVTFSGQIEYVTFSGGVFDDYLCIHYEFVWGPDWAPISGLSMGSSQMSSIGTDPEKAVFNMPIDMVFSSTNIYGWPQLVVTVKAHNRITGESLRGYALALMPSSTGLREITAPILRPRASTTIGEWVAWLTGKYPELVEPKLLAHGKDNYLLRTESEGTITLNVTMMSKNLRKLGYDNQPPSYRNM
ncbi:B9 domain-containing protein 1 [Manduca sexta]|uniref:B9 domain-containing protein 1 n=1 Tax=Manduca sexta TaxID=7130 RepID=A0A922CIF9_MANSE|nr:B9 domain-containing protein 1 [Manduca sexta]KAG6447078.1 hypothetical protein O3G_MSEX004761 [Manduca sexta]KAG6447079.1 hypothetical protein O3G_MSEX004761 [Manduca sexta]